MWQPPLSFSVIGQGECCTHGCFSRTTAGRFPYKVINDKLGGCGYGPYANCPGCVGQTSNGDPINLQKCEEACERSQHRYGSTYACVGFNFKVTNANHFPSYCQW